jgi:hypothetical protein
MKFEVRGRLPVESPAMTKLEEEDPLEFDPFADPAPEPPRPPPPATRGLSESALFGDVAPEPQPEAEPPEPPPEPTRTRKPSLQIDFSEVLGPGRDVQGALRVGATSLDMGDFMTKEDRAALERAQTAPRASLPSTLEVDEFGSGVRVVAENKRVWVWVVAGVVLSVLIALGIVWGRFKHLQVKREQEIEELRRADEIHRKAAEQHEQQMLR